MKRHEKGKGALVYLKKKLGESKTVPTNGARRKTKEGMAKKLQKGGGYEIPIPKRVKRALYKGDSNVVL